MVLVSRRVYKACLAASGLITYVCAVSHSGALRTQWKLYVAKQIIIITIMLKNVLTLAPRPSQKFFLLLLRALLISTNKKVLKQVNYFKTKIIKQQLYSQVLTFLFIYFITKQHQNKRPASILSPRHRVALYLHGINSCLSKQEKFTISVRLKKILTLVVEVWPCLFVIMYLERT